MLGQYHHHFTRMGKQILFRWHDIENRYKSLVKILDVCTSIVGPNFVVETELNLLHQTFALLRKNVGEIDLWWDIFMAAHFWQRPMKVKNTLKFAKLSATAAQFFFTSIKGESLGCPNHGNIDSRKTQCRKSKYCWQNVRFRKAQTGPEIVTWGNFTNVLWAAFTRADPKTAKRHWCFYCLFCTFSIFECKSCV